MHVYEVLGPPPRFARFRKRNPEEPHGPDNSYWDDSLYYEVVRAQTPDIYQRRPGRWVARYRPVLCNPTRQEGIIHLGTRGSRAAAEHLYRQCRDDNLDLVPVGSVDWSVDDWRAYYHSRYPSVPASRKPRARSPVERLKPKVYPTPSGKWTAMISDPETGRLYRLGNRNTRREALKLYSDALSLVLAGTPAAEVRKELENLLAVPPATQ